MLRDRHEKSEEIYQDKQITETFSISQTPQVALDHQAYNRNGTYTFVWDYVEELFDKNAIQQAFSAYMQLIQKLAEADDWNQIV